MLIICKKYPLSSLLASERTKDITQGLIPAVADIKKNRLAITGKRSENHNDLANYLVAEEGSSLDDIYDLAVATDGKIFFRVSPGLTGRWQRRSQCNPGSCRCMVNFF